MNSPLSLYQVLHLHIRPSGRAGCPCVWLLLPEKCLEPRGTFTTRCVTCPTTNYTFQIN